MIVDDKDDVLGVTHTHQAVLFQVTMLGLCKIYVRIQQNKHQQGVCLLTKDRKSRPHGMDSYNIHTYRIL